MRIFNYTGRRTIQREYISITEEEPLKLKLSCNLEEFDFPSDSEIYIEIQNRGRYERLNAGSIISPRADLLSVNVVEDFEGVNFRLVVVNGHGKILGHATRLKLDSNSVRSDPSQSIFPVRSTDLSSSGLLWRLAKENDEWILDVEESLGSKEQVTKSRIFRGFILPEAARQIIREVAETADWDEELADTDNVGTRWMILARKLSGRLPETKPEAESDLDEWRDDREVWLDEVSKALTRDIDVRAKVIEEFGDKSW